MPINRCPPVSLLGLASALMFLASVPAHSQSFDCQKATSAIEHQICADKALGELDATLGTKIRQMLADNPSRRAAILANERQWLKDRDRRCEPRGARPADVTVDCLTARYTKRLAELTTLAATLAKWPASAQVCRTLAARYRPLAGSHPGETPLSVLASTAGSGVTTQPPESARFAETAALLTWGKEQSPPVSMDPVVASWAKTYSSGTPVPERIGNTALYSMVSVQGTANCLMALFFSVKEGQAQLVAPPAGILSEGHDCMVSLQYGTVDGSPAYFQEQYLWTPDMSSTLTVGLIRGAQFEESCDLDFRFAPVFTHETLNNWEEQCEGGQCDDLRKAAFSLAEAVQADAGKARQAAHASLTAAQQAIFAAALKLAEADTPSANDRDPAELTDTAPLRLPYLFQGKVYVASLGHFTIGWRQFGDWSVSFAQAEDGKLVERGSFAVGMQKGRLESVLIDGVPE